MVALGRVVLPRDRPGPWRRSRALEHVLVAELKPGNTARSTGEAKLSHLQDLRSRLVAARLTPADLVTADLLADKALVARARKKLRDRHLDGRAKTPVM